MSATVKELLKSDSICESYAQMKRCPVFNSQRISTASSEAKDCHLV